VTEETLVSMEDVEGAVEGTYIVLIREEMGGGGKIYDNRRTAL
jgi:hypothetical protein